MKHTKKLFAIALTLIMALALSVPAFAAVDNTQKTITIANPEDGQTYTAYKIFDATMASTNYAYSIDGDSQFFATVLAFINDADAAADTKVYSGNGLTLTKTTEASASGSDFKWNVVADNTLSAANFAAHLNAAIQAGTFTAASNSGEVDEGATTATISVIGAGYYFVDSTLGSLCALDTADTATIYEKNSIPTIAKEVQEDSDGEWGATADADFNQTVNFKLTVNTGTNTNAPAGTPQDEGVDVNDTDGADYVITDTLPVGMTYSAITSVVAVVGEGDTAAETSWVATTNYTVAYEEKDTGDVLTITLKKESVTALGQDADIVIIYTATVDTDAAIATANTNTAILTYNGETAQATSTVYVYELGVFKYTPSGNADDATTADVDESKTPLAGAKFKLYKEVTTGEGDAAVTTTYYAVTATADANDVYVFDSWTTDADQATVFVSPADGEFTVRGLDTDTYKLVETEAPAGYNVLTAPVDAVLSGVVQVENLSGTELPSTGGIGTTIFYVVGALLMAGAGVLLVTKKRMADEE